MNSNQYQGSPFWGGALIGFVVGGVLGLYLGDGNLLIVALCAAVGMLAFAPIAGLACIWDKAKNAGFNRENKRIS